MVFYEANLGVFAAANAYLLYRQYRGRSSAGGGYEKVDASSRDDVVREDVDDGHEDVESTAATATNHIEAPPGAVRQFQRDFFIVYALAVAADWLQVRRRTACAAHGNCHHET